MLLLRHHQGTCLVMLLVLLAGLTPGRAASASDSLVKMSTLVGMEVENRDGVELGRLQDFALNLSTGRIQYGIITSGGFIGFGRKTRVVPASILSAATAKRNTIALDVTIDRWNDAPLFRVSELQSLSSPAVARKIYRFYRVPLSATGRPLDETSPELRVYTELVGRAVVGRDRQKLGEIQDLLVDLNLSSPVFALVSMGRFFKGSDHDFAVLISALKPDGKRRLTLDTSPERLSAAPEFATGAWKEAGTEGAPRVFRYRAEWRAGDRTEQRGVPETSGQPAGPASNAPNPRSPD